MSSAELLDHLADLVWSLAEDEASALGSTITDLPPDSTATGPPLQGRLLAALPSSSEGNALARFARAALGGLGEDSPIRLHGWQRAGAPSRGIALVATQGSAKAVLAVTPGDPPTGEVVVTPGAAIAVEAGEGPWRVRAAISSGAVWDAAFGPEVAAGAPVGTATIRLQRVTPVTVGPTQGPGLSARQITCELRTAPGSPAAVAITFDDFRAAILPEPLAALLGAGKERSTGPAKLQIQADAAGGVRFGESGLRLELPGRLALPGLSAKGFAVELASDGAGLSLAAVVSLRAALPGVPVRVQLDGVGVRVPFSLSSEAIGPKLQEITAPLPSGIGVELALPPVSGGGDVRTTPTGGYAGVLDVDLGVFRVQALGVLQLPTGGAPTSLLALLAAVFPYPGIQLGFGFSIDAVGGLVGINRRVDVERLRGLVSDGHADRVLFPGNAVERAQEITGSLDAVFPAARGRCVIGPMVRISWGGRIMTLAGAVVLDLPSPAQVVLLGRLLVAIPDPAAPLVRLQASVFGRIDPSVPETELLVSLAGSWIVGMPVSGELYLLLRGGDRAAFVLSAGGFHPRYVRPPGVPALRRLSIDLGGGGLGLRAEAYLAVTSNAMMFGAKLQLDAKIAGCGVEGHLGLDALFVWEPTFAFSVRVYAGVAVLAFGRRLASVALDFTLEGPAPWHAFGTGSISVLFWDVSLDFDVRWGDAPASLPGRQEIFPLLERVLAAPGVWTAERPVEQRAAVTLTEQARTDLTRGDVVPADVTLRVRQTVVPLDESITRFARTLIPAQRWSIVGASLTGEAPAALGARAIDRFVAGEFFSMTEDEQLTRPAFAELTSGVALSDKDVVSGPAHVVDDSYETGYEVEPGFQTQDAGLTYNLALGRFWLESFARVATPAERLDRWRSAQTSVSGDAEPAVVIR